MQGETLHWTISCGASICESSNFYLPMAENGSNFEENSRLCIRALRRCHRAATSRAIQKYLADRAKNANIIRSQMDFKDVKF